MANPDRPIGLRYAYHKLGGEPSVIKHTSNGEIFAGDAVILESDGDVDAATAGARLYGVAVNYVSTTGEDVWVIKDPYAVFSIQDDGVSATIAEADYGRFADLIVAAGDTDSGLSRMELDTSSITANSAQLRIEKKNGSILVQRPENSIGKNAEVYVSLYEHHDMIAPAAATVDTSPGV